MFEKEKYYNYIQVLEGIIIAQYIIILTIGLIAGTMTKNVIYMLLFYFISYLIVIITTIKMKIKIQKMKLDIDIYNYITKKI